MKKKLVAALLTVSMVASLAGCGSTGTEGASNGTSDGGSSSESGEDAAAEGELDYQFGADVTFHSDEPISYPLMYSDHENYPSKDDWLLWKAIEERTNVKFDLTLVARTDYDDKVSALVNAGDAPYIIPKIYNEGPFVDSGQVVPVSEYVQYMPNYMKCVEEWGMADDLEQILKSDGKYYRLPGMWEQSAGGYSLVIRKDIFEAAGVNVEEEEKNWTWETFYDALVKVKEHTGGDYVWSDQYELASTMNLAAAEYGVRAGFSSDGGDWGIKNLLTFDTGADEFVFPSTSDNYKDFLTYFNKLYKEGLIDKETFTQDAETAKAKFFRGDSYVINMNYQTMANAIAEESVQVDGAELYMITPPGGPEGKVQVESSRLENGIMIAENARKELGEEGFIKMMRFIDWLWYSDEGQTLVLWGVEGETYTVENDEIVLNSDIYYNGINPGAEKQLNVDYGFGGGVFAYGGSTKLRFSKFSEGEKDWNYRVYDYNPIPRPIDPPILSDEMETEELNLLLTPLRDYVTASALQFITGSMDIETQWEEYVAQCESKSSQKYLDLSNEIYKSTKDLLSK